MTCRRCREVWHARSAVVGVVRHIEMYMLGASRIRGQHMARFRLRVGTSRHVTIYWEAHQRVMHDAMLNVRSPASKYGSLTPRAIEEMKTGCSHYENLHVAFQEARTRRFLNVPFFISMTCYQCVPPACVTPHMARPA